MNKIKRSEFHSAFVIQYLFLYVYGFLIVKLRPRATTAKESNITNGAMYEPEFMSRVFANVAMNDATMRLKLMID